MDCGGKSDATPLFRRQSMTESGVALRFPRVSRIRWDKPAGEADLLETLMRRVPA